MFHSKVHTRIRYVFMFSIIILLLVIGKVFYIEVFSYDKLKKLSDELYSRKLPIKADRGDIVDRNGKVLATSVTTTSLVVIPRQIKDKEKVAKDLSEILKSSYDDMLAHLSKKTSIERVHPEGRKLSYDIASKIEDLNYDGVYLVKESKRYYPYKGLLAHTLGYVGIDNQGLSGLELMYDKLLTGEDGSIKYFSDGKGNRLKMAEVYESAKSGITLGLTIDLDLQMVVENELNNIVSKYEPDGAIIIAQDPNNGEILALGSRPGFDPNNYQEYDKEIINRNLPIWMTYEPGSTFKIITLASSIEEKTIDIMKDTFTDTGSINIEGATLHCWKHGGHGVQTYLEVVENSCNPGFVSMGMKLGTTRLMNYIRKFGFGKKTGIDLNGEGNGILFKDSNMGPVETATTSFGQGISVTPIQQITAVSAVINGGKLYTPFVVKSLIDRESKTVLDTNKSKLKANVISKDTSSLVRFALESVVANGTGHNAYLANYRVGGKTGTAQKVVNGHYSKSSYILSFIGFMPASNPQIIVYVAIDGAHNVTQYGGTASAPVAKNILSAAVDILNIKEDLNGMPKEFNYLDKNYIIVPNVVNLNIEDAKKVLKKFKLIFSGEGNTIAYQVPKDNMYIEEGSSIMLMLK